MIATSALADAIDEAASRLIAGVETAMLPTTLSVPLRRTVERPPGLMRDLVGRLRADRLDDTRAPPSLPRFDITEFVTALRLLRRAIYALIDERPVPITSRDVRIIGAWFADAIESALILENRITVASDADDVVLSVSNRGASISPALAERIFEPFKQGDDVRSRHGLGLGLFIVREIARAHGGTVDVRSGDGVVTFTAKLPRSPAAKEERLVAYDAPNP